MATKKQKKNPTKRRKADKKDYIIYSLSAVLLVLMIVGTLVLAKSWIEDIREDGMRQGRQQLMNEMTSSIESQGTFNLVLSVEDGEARSIALAPHALAYEEGMLDLAAQIRNHIETDGNVELTIPSPDDGPAQTMVLVPYEQQPQGGDMGGMEMNPEDFDDMMME